MPSRHADKTAQLWFTRLQESNTTKRLTLIYLANEVVQQSRARQKTDFLFAFEPLISDATEIAYKSASQEVQSKLKRVVEVWSQRKIFSPAIQTTIDQKIEAIDKQRGNRSNGSGMGKLGGSLFGGSGSLPTELKEIAKSQGDLSKVGATLAETLEKANTEFGKMTDPETPIPTPPLHAARLSALLKNLASAQGAVEASIKARKELLTGLEHLLESNRGKLADEEGTMADLTNKRENIEGKKREVEDGIMRGLSAPTSPENPTPPPSALGSRANGFKDDPGANESSGIDVERPETEGFTPPPPDVEDFTPPPTQDLHEPKPLLGDEKHIFRSFESTTGAEAVQEQPPVLTEPPPAFEPPPALQTHDSAAAAANQFLENLNVGHIRPGTSDAPGDPRLKRRKLSHKETQENDEVFGMGAVEGVDEDGIGALLGQ